MAAPRPPASHLTMQIVRTPCFPAALVDNCTSRHCHGCCANVLLSAVHMDEMRARLAKFEEEKETEQAVGSLSHSGRTYRSPRL